jgi:ketosteroid isomerase-like protein
MPNSPDPVRLVNVRKFLMSISDDKLDDVDHLLSPDIVYTVPGRHPLAGVFRGPDEVKRHLADLLTLTARSYDVLKWVDWMVGESHIAVLQFLQVQRGGAVYRGHQLFLVQSDPAGLLSDIYVYLEDQEATDEFFSR